MMIWKVGFNPAVQALRFAIGEIEEETLMSYLRKGKGEGEGIVE